MLGSGGHFPSRIASGMTIIQLTGLRSDQVDWSNRRLVGDCHTAPPTGRMRTRERMKRAYTMGLRGVRVNKRSLDRCISSHSLPTAPIFSRYPITRSLASSAIPNEA